MGSMFYSKLAAANIKKNGKQYFPYIITCTITVAMYYIMKSLSLNDGIDKLIGADTISYTMGLGCIIVAIFALIFLFYTNSFLIKHRKKEFGLFNILGMEKRHILYVMALESIYISIISIAAGIGLGILLDKLMYLIILKFFGLQVSLGFYISSQAILSTLVLFAAIFGIIFINSFFQIQTTKPIELLHGGQLGEKEPKTKWFMAILGVVCLLSGYYLAVVTKNPVSAISIFFGAVILVIIGTYLLFTVGSIAILKLLRKNKSYYYKTQNFISISSMIYRMKQNAIGLANICILSTMVLVMISSTLSLIIGFEKIFAANYPYDITLYSFQNSEEVNNDIVSISNELLSQSTLEEESSVQYNFLSFSAVKNENKFLTDIEPTIDNLDKMNILFFIPLSNYNSELKQNETLNSNEAMLYNGRELFNYNSLEVFGEELQIKKVLKEFVGNGILASNMNSVLYLVVTDEHFQLLYEKQKAQYENNASETEFCYGLNLTGTESEQIEFYNSLHAQLNQKEYNYTIDVRAGSYATTFSFYAGLFFLGIFLGLLFIMATILIIYYKQISEGYNDRERFKIMQNIGMSHTQIKRNIRSQIVTVFFLPLVTAGVHVAFAFPVIVKILSLLNLNDARLFAFCTLGCFIAFAVFYALIYSLTARIYYRIVSK